MTRSIYDYARVVIVGGPRCGKTTLANSYQQRTRHAVLHTDDVILDSELKTSTHFVAQWLEQPAPWVIEGTTAGLALDEWMHTYQYQGMPCDCAIGLWTPRKALTYEQASMLRYLRSRWHSIAQHLRDRGVFVLNHARVGMLEC